MSQNADTLLPAKNPVRVSPGVIRLICAQGFILPAAVIAMSTIWIAPRIHLSFWIYVGIFVVLLSMMQGWVLRKSITRFSWWVVSGIVMVSAAYLFSLGLLRWSFHAPFLLFLENSLGDSIGYLVEVGSFAFLAGICFGALQSIGLCCRRIYWVIFSGITYTVGLEALVWLIAWNGRGPL